MHQLIPEMAVHVVVRWADDRAYDPVRQRVCILRLAQDPVLTREQPLLRNLDRRTVLAYRHSPFALLGHDRGLGLRPEIRVLLHPRVHALRLVLCEFQLQFGEVLLHLPEVSARRFRPELVRVRETVLGHAELFHIGGDLRAVLEGEERRAVLVLRVHQDLQLDRAEHGELPIVWVRGVRLEEHLEVLFDFPAVGEARPELDDPFLPRGACENVR
mmetsp:Transcript_47364/g.112478  ORF Transcript_47364/g.112478 Transcript_47364/m.112478 type:complete len:215 (-) Transcript_47364:359-1003(-)